MPKAFITEANVFGLYRRYPTKPQRDPEGKKVLRDWCDPRAFPGSCPSTEGRVPSAFVQHITLHGAARSEPDVSSSDSSAIIHAVPTEPVNLYAPCRNPSEFLLLHWQYTHGSATSNISVNSLVNDVILHPDFSVDDLRGGFSIEAAQKRLDKGGDALDKSLPFSPHDGWIKTSVKIRVPKEGV